MDDAVPGHDVGDYDGSVGAAALDRHRLVLAGHSPDGEVQRPTRVLRLHRVQLGERGQLELCRTVGTRVDCMYCVQQDGVAVIATATSANVFRTPA